MSEEREKYQVGDEATLRDYWQPEEETRFDRLFRLAEVLTEEQDALEDNSGSLSEAALLKSIGLTLQTVYIERERLVNIAKARMRSKA